MTNLQYKAVPIGTEDFAALRSDGCYYVDKTEFLKTVFEDQGPVFFITRPRRFGKTLLMSMFSYFLRTKVDGDRDLNNKLVMFNGLKILNDKDFVDQYMGRFPVLSLSLKSVYSDNFEQAYKMLGMVICHLSRSLSFLFESHRLLDQDKSQLKKLMNDDIICSLDNRYLLADSLKILTTLLYKHFDKSVILLIDEYDVPLAYASEHNYHADMVTLMSSFFDVLKINHTNYEDRTFIKKAILTGCLKVAKNSIFTGVNNLSVNTVISNNDSLSSIIGFTHDEVSAFLDDYDLSEYEDIVKKNYDGYRFGSRQIFCPWDVVNFVKDAHEKKLSGNCSRIKADNYWITSTSSGVLLDYIGYLSHNEQDKLQSLMDGKNITSQLNDAMSYDDLKLHRSADFFSLLIHTGYLTVIDNNLDAADGLDSIYTLKIPNIEIKKCFAKNIMDNFYNATCGCGDTDSGIVQALFKGDSQQFGKQLNTLLKQYISIRDFAGKSKKENFYHGFLSGVFSNCGDLISEYKSNGELGLGYADIAFRNKAMDRAVVIEIKSSASEKDLVDDASGALLQIKNLGYALPYVELATISSVFIYGISFYKKICYCSCQI